MHKILRLIVLNIARDDVCNSLYKKNQELYGKLQCMFCYIRIPKKRGENAGKPIKWSKRGFHISKLPCLAGCNSCLNLRVKQVDSLRLKMCMGIIVHTTSHVFPNVPCTCSSNDVVILKVKTIIQDIPTLQFVYFMIPHRWGIILI